MVALTFTPALEEIDGSDNSSIALRLPSDQALRVSVAVSFGEQHEEANISSRARSWAADMDGAFATAARERQVSLLSATASSRMLLLCCVLVACVD